MQTLPALTGAAHTGGVFWTFTLKQTYFFYSFGVDGLKRFIIQDDKKVIKKYSLGQRNDKNRQQNKPCNYYVIIAFIVLFLENI